MGSHSDRSVLMRMTCTIGALAVALAARAQDAAWGPRRLLAVPVAPDTVIVEPKIRAPAQPVLAVTISLVATAAPVAIGVHEALTDGSATAAIPFFAGIVFGPATGYWYGHADGWVKGVIIRGAFGGAMAALGSKCGFGCVIPAGIAGAVLVVSSIRDIAHADGAVREANAKLRLTASPTWDPARRAPGLAATLRF
jgi:hypothetical protein